MLALQLTHETLNNVFSTCLLIIVLTSQSLCSPFSFGLITLSELWNILLGISVSYIK